MRENLREDQKSSKTGIAMHNKKPETLAKKL